jgi:hypothetical protein
MYELDATTAGEAYARPGMDTRQWGSYGTVCADTPDAPSVLYDDPETGNPLPFPMVMVTLQPSGITVPCRVMAPATGAAGAGEGEWNPYVANDEVYVVIPEGHERAGCAIVGRFNQVFDNHPRTVAGQDATKNTFAYKRTRAPYIFETSSSYLVRSAGTKAFMSMDQAGSWTIANGDNNMLRIGSDFLALQLGDNSALVQVTPAAGSTAAQVFMQGDAAQFLLDATATALLTPGNISFSSAGNQPLEHVTTIEAVVNLFTALGQALITLGPVPLLSNVLGALLVTGFPAVVAAASTTPMLPTATAAIALGLAVPKGPGLPGLGAPGFQVG